MILARKNKEKKELDDTRWKKRFVFSELPYWKHNKCRHNFDVMHIEKNICDNIIGTLVDILGKSKDHTKACEDLLELGIKEDIQPSISNDGEDITLPQHLFNRSCTERFISKGL